jgi:hypothetical protein
MPAGAAWLFVPQAGLTMHFNQPWGTKQDAIEIYADIIAQMVRDFAPTHEMNAFIDSVTIEGVGLVGPDRGSIRSRGQDVRAPREINMENEEAVKQLRRKLR